MRQRLTEYLQASGRVSEAQLAQALRTQKFFGGSLLYNLVRLDVIREPEAEEILSQWSGYPYAPLPDLRRIPGTILSLLDPAVASRRRIIPFQGDPGSLGVATSRVDNEPFFRDLERKAGLPVAPHAILEERLELLLERHYGIPAPRRDAVRPVETQDPLAAGAPSTPEDDSASAGPDEAAQVGLDGLPLESDAVPHQILPSRGGGGISPLAEALGPEVDESGEQGTLPRTVATDGPSGTFHGGMDEPVAPATPRPRPATAEGSPGERLALAQDRQSIGRAAVELGLSQGLGRVVLLGHQKERLVGWDGGGPGIDPARVGRLSVPLYTASIFAGFRVNLAPYVGILPDQPANRELMAILGGKTPQVVTVVPVVVKDRLAAALYADAGPGSSQPVDLQALTGLAAKVAGALEILLLRRKILS